MNLDLTKLDKAERLRLWRWRHGLTQREVADQLGLARESYINAEHHGRGRTIWPMVAAQLDTPAPTFDEALKLARRRYGQGRVRLAHALNTSHVTVWKMERRRDPKLLAFWKAQGFFHPDW